MSYPKDKQTSPLNFPPFLFMSAHAYVHSCQLLLMRAYAWRVYCKNAGQFRVKKLWLAKCTCLKYTFFSGSERRSSVKTLT
jgi:hypothetical protein